MKARRPRDPDSLIEQMTGRLSKISGRKYHKRQGVTRPTGRPKPVVPYTEILARDFYFPAHEWTKARERNLEKRIDRYIKEDFISHHLDGPSTKTIGRLLGLKESQAAAAVKSVRELDGTPCASFVLDILYGMFVGTFASIQETPRCKDHVFAFEVVHRFDMWHYFRDLPEAFHKITIVPAPMARCVGAGDARREIRDDQGRTRVVNVYRLDADGTAWHEDPYERNQLHLLRTMHARFRIDFNEWLLRGDGQG